MLSDVDGDHRLAIGDGLEAIQDVLSSEPTLLRVLERVLSLPPRALLQPGVGVRPLDERDQILQDQAGVALQQRSGRTTLLNSEKSTSM